MIKFKELLEKFPSNGLDNLGEKMRWEYVDAMELPDNETFSDEVLDVVEDLTEKVSKYEFTDDMSDNYHPFIKCDKELVKKLGFDNITVCAYKGYESEPIESNFIYYDSNDDEIGKQLTIDIYNVTNKIREEIRDDIFQELLNFVRDAQWAIDGVYEERMEEMKNYFNFDEDFKEIPEECFSCKNAFHFHDGVCRCFIESDYGTLHNDSDCCNNYDAVDETTFLDRSMWKELGTNNEEMTKQIDDLGNYIEKLFEK